MNQSVSVAMCTYNGARFLAQQLESFSRQTDPLDELVVCDDGSSDETISILRRFQADAAFAVKIFENKPALGVTRNFEKAAGACSGDLIFFSDQDDIWSADKVKMIKAHFRQNPHAEAVFSDGWLIDENSHRMPGTLWAGYGFNDSCRKKWKNGLALKDLLYNRNKVTGATLAITSKLYERIIPFEERAGWFHDQFIASHAAATNSLDWISEPLIEYRIHPAQQVGLNLPKKSSAPENVPAFTLLDVLRFEAQDSRESLERMRTFLRRYPNVSSAEIEKEMSNREQFFSGRAHLPQHTFARIKTVLGNFQHYQKFTPAGFRSMLRDIVRPAS
jgi:glycosyltransferase involved in cell wall biosynthesis